MISLRRRFTFWSLGATALLAALAGASLYLYVRTTLYREFDAGLRSRAQLIGSLLRIEDNGQYGMDFSDESMPEYMPGRRPEYFQVITPNGRTLQRSESLKGKNLVATAAARATMAPWNLVLPNGRPGRGFAILAQPYPDSDDHDRPVEQEPAKRIDKAPALVIVAQDRSPINHALEPLLSALMLAGLILAMGSIVIVRFVVWQALKPVNGLARHAQLIGPANLNYRFETAALPEELQPICQRLNELLERLDQAFRRERRLNADIAHELRTPIAELRSLTEVACRWPMDAEQSAAYFNDAHAIALKMGSLIDTLLTLSRAQMKVGTGHAEMIALAPIVEQSLSSRKEQIQQRQLHILNSIAESHFIVSNRVMFSRIIDNIVANAVDYASPGGIIECKVEVRDGEYWLTAGNSNDSLNADDLKYVFEAFWRKDPARTDSAHRGLGLALVAEYAVELGIRTAANLCGAAWFEMALQIPGAEAGKVEKPRIANCPAPMMHDG